MKIWAVSVYSDIHLFTNEHDYDLFMDVHYARIWEQNMGEIIHPSWPAMKGILTGENIPDEEFPTVHIQDLVVPPDPEEAFGCLYTYTDLADHLDGQDYDRATLEEWVKQERGKIEGAMAEVVAQNMPDDLMDPGAYWRWDQTGDYKEWAKEQRK